MWPRRWPTFFGFGSNSSRWPFQRAGLARFSSINAQRAGAVQHGFDAPSQARGGLGRLGPQRRENPKHALGVDLVDWRVADWRAVFRQRHRPLRPVLGVLPLAALRLDVGVSDFAKGGLSGLGR